MFTFIMTIDKFRFISAVFVPAIHLTFFFFFF